MMIAHSNNVLPQCRCCLDNSILLIIQLHAKLVGTETHKYVYLSVQYVYSGFGMFCWGKTLNRGLCIIPLGSVTRNLDTMI